MAAGWGYAIGSIGGALLSQGNDGGRSVQQYELPQWLQDARQRLIQQGEAAYGATSPLSFEQALAYNDQLQSQPVASPAIPGTVSRSPGDQIALPSPAPSPAPTGGNVAGIGGAGTPSIQDQGFYDQQVREAEQRVRELENNIRMQEQIQSIGGGMGLMERQRLDQQRQELEQLQSQLPTFRAMQESARGRADYQDSPELGSPITGGGLELGGSPIDLMAASGGQVPAPAGGQAPAPGTQPTMSTMGNVGIPEENFGQTGPGRTIGQPLPGRGVPEEGLPQSPGMQAGGIGGIQPGSQSIDGTVSGLPGSDQIVGIPGTPEGGGGTPPWEGRQDIGSPAGASDPFNPNTISLQDATPRLANLTPEQLGAISAGSGFGTDYINLAMGEDAQTQAGMDLQRGLDSGTALAERLQGVGDPTMELAQSQIRGDYLHPESNPYLEDLITASTRPLEERFQEEILPSIQSEAIQSGAYGGAREGLVSATAARDLTRNLGDIRSGILGENYARERQYMQQAPELLRQGVNLNQVSPEMMINLGRERAGIGERGIGLLDQAGGRLQQQEQARRDALFDQFLRAQQAPFRRIERLTPIVQGTAGGSTSTTQQSLNSLTSAMRGASGGGQLGGAIADAFSNSNFSFGGSGSQAYSTPGGGTAYTPTERSPNQPAF